MSDTNEKEFSEGFMHDIADLLDMCVAGGTDSIELKFNVNNKTLRIDITFSIDTQTNDESKKE